MYTLKIPNNDIYSITGTLTELMEQLATEFNASRERPTDGYEEYFEAVWPTDPSDVDEDFEIPTPVEINKESVMTFAQKVWDTPHVELIGPAQPLTHGEFHAMLHHLGLGHGTLGEMLGGVAAKTISRWISGNAGKPVPARVTGEMEELLDRHDVDVEKICEMGDRGVVIYPRDETEQQLEGVPLGWEMRVIQRAAVEHGIRVYHRSEFSGVDYFEST